MLNADPIPLNLARELRSGFYPILCGDDYFFSCEKIICFQYSFGAEYNNYMYFEYKIVEKGKGWYKFYVLLPNN